jgi:hypothetical protein
LNLNIASNREEDKFTTNFVAENQSVCAQTYLPTVAFFDLYRRHHRHHFVIVLVEFCLSIFPFSQPFSFFAGVLVLLGIRLYHGAPFDVES